MLLASLEVTKKEVTRALVSLAADGQLANNTTPAVGLLAITNGSLAGGGQVGSVGSNGEAAVDVSCIVTSQFVTSQFVTSQSLAIVFALSSAGESINNSSSKFLLSSSSCDPKLCCSSSISVRRVKGRRSSHHLVVLQDCDHLTV